ncbi:MAG: tRNA (adenosine(37)-N6)-threonylcarbamoyltransferase complex transferase subunit TsaD [Chloroflexi bacterium]|nr:tRNA (adenosine(37)-N6)-threonylcarbamoyltransferase complex transferase subunit TsaD [Chloroflexota bacterium]MDA1173108.1 tRNA (adenosine(37)-N6)-threonylcarbamoyltransferase complex transferase subunit TsaD [Chloroflexota bacterium]
MLVLGIESSCDETAAAVVEDGIRVLSDVVSSQVAIHARYGGVVPEVASRQHLLQIVPVLEGALAKAEVTLDAIDVVAVTQGPGLMGSLMVGVNTAKAIAYARDLPLVGVHHLEGHTYAAWLGGTDPAVDPGFPLIVLIASGAHTDLIVMRGHGDYEVVGRTRDDAAGEAFDKAGRILGLGYPGGPVVQRTAEGITPSFKLPRAWLGDSLDFSFSGLKTAVLHKAQELGVYPAPEAGADATLVADIAAAFQDAVVDVIATKAIAAVKRYGAKGLVLGGGVSANGPLREACRQAPVPVIIPAPKLCTDNGSMIGAAGYYRFIRGVTHGMALDATPSLALG